MTTISARIGLHCVVIYDKKMQTPPAIFELECSRFIALFGPRHK